MQKADIFKIVLGILLLIIAAVTFFFYFRPSTNGIDFSIDSNEDISNISSENEVIRGNKSLEDKVSLIENILASFGDDPYYKPDFSVNDWINYQSSIYSTHGDAVFTHREISGNQYDWGLYFYDGKTKEVAKIFSGLIHDCCGGGIPEIDGSYKDRSIIVRSSTGDECFWHGQEVLVRMPSVGGEPTISKVVEYGNDCSSRDYLNLTIGSYKYTFEPQFSGVCAKFDGTESVYLTGLKATSLDSNFTYNFSEPLKSLCIDVPDLGNTVDKIISYENISLLNSFDFDLSIYQYNSLGSKVLFTKYLNFDEKIGLTDR